MKHAPPFIPNSDDDIHCVAAVYRMIFRHYLNKDYSWQEIDAIAKAIPGKGTWNVPLDIAVAKAGIQVKNIELTDFEVLHAGGIKYLKAAFGEKNAAYYIEQTNIMNIIDDIPEFLRLIPHESRKATIEEILQYLAEGKLIAAEVNSGVLNNHGKFNLHMVLLHDSDSTHITLHDPGLPPLPARKVTVQEFTDSFAYPGSNQGIDIFSKSLSTNA